MIISVLSACPARTIPIASQGAATSARVAHNFACRLRATQRDGASPYPAVAAIAHRPVCGGSPSHGRGWNDLLGPMLCAVPRAALLRSCLKTATALLLVTPPVAPRRLASQGRLTRPENAPTCRADHLQDFTLSAAVLRTHPCIRAPSPWHAATDKLFVVP